MLTQGIVILIVAGLFGMGQFIWFPDSAKLLQILLTDATPPVDPYEVWAAQLYRETFSPDYGSRWIPRFLVMLAWVSWVQILLLTLLDTLFMADLLPKSSVVFWVVFLDTLLFAISSGALLCLQGAEMLLLHHKNIPLDFRERKKRYICANPLPKSPLPAAYTLQSASDPWWFWLDSNLSEMAVRMAIFLGGFTLSVVVVLYLARVSNPQLVSVPHFWGALLLWLLAIFWLAIPLTVWLSHIDWAVHQRDVLLRWASRQQ